MDGLLVRAATGLQQPNDFAGRGVPLEFRFLENRMSLVRNLEPSAARRNQFDVRIRKTLANLGGQTGRPRLVVSHRAVFDPHAHGADSCSSGFGHDSTLKDSATSEQVAGAGGLRRPAPMLLDDAT